MNALCRNLRAVLMYGYGTVSMLLVLSACITQTAPPSASQLMLTPPQLGVPCAACAQATLDVVMTQQQINNDLQVAAAAEPARANAQATLDVVMTQQQINTDLQVAAAAELVRANAQATLNSANGTLSAVQTQQQNEADVIAAQMAAAAEIVRANAQATLQSAGSTQSAALTADAIHQTQMADVATTGAQAVLDQQYKNDLAAGTQTAIANVIAGQKQSAAATSQWYLDRGRRREEQAINFLWVWCFPMFVVMLAGLVVWEYWHRFKIQQSNQRLLEKQVGRLPATVVDVSPHQHALPQFDPDRTDEGYQVTSPNDQVEQWLDEVKDNLLDSDEKDKDDNPDS